MQEIWCRLWRDEKIVRKESDQGMFEIAEYEHTAGIRGEMEIWFLGCILILGGSSKGLKEEITKYADSDAEYVGYKEKSEYSVIIIHK